MKFTERKLEFEQEYKLMILDEYIYCRRKFFSGIKPDLLEFTKLNTYIHL